MDDFVRRHVPAFDVNGDGSAASDFLFFDYLGVIGEHTPDGLKLDVEGNI